ncbi:MAG TPA: restriction endonuclease subunit S [Thermoanaerobaculia bacterium]|nr:restriction endonuclease subunit S [Thermoanaerobaculia bacterium]
MTHDEFFKEFELVAELPNAILKMRELVFRTAFSGRLTKRNGADVTWQQRTIGDLAASITPGFACSKSHQVTNGHVHLRTHNISTRGSLNFDLLVKIDPAKVDVAKSSLQAGDILFNNTNSQELVGKTAFVERNYNYGFSNHLTRIRMKPEVDPRFAVWYLTFLRNSGHFSALCTRWINQAAINSDSLKRLSIGLPPLAEQKRIVAKVDELMALCDRLEAQQKEHETRHVALARGSLARFANVPTPANLTFLFHKSYTIAPAELRKVILDLALRGKLIKHGATDEPPDATFPRLAAASVVCDDGRFPRTWLRVPLLETGEWRGGGTPSKSRAEYWTGDLPWVSPKDMKALHIFDAQDHISRSALEDTSIRLIPEGSLLMVVRGMILARAFPVALTKRDVTINQDMKALLPIEPGTTDFLLLALRALEPTVLQQIERSSHGTCKLKTESLQELLIPIPPLAEQRRILVKVDQLMALVDELEAQLIASRTTGAKLLDAIVSELSSFSKGAER